MKKSRSNSFVARLGVPGAAGVLGLTLGVATGAGEAQASQRYALLVGVTDYPSLDERLWLRGPANDVVLIEQVLLQQGFSSDAITVLSQGENSEGEPTRDAILGAIDELAATVAPGDFVYLHFGGHGSQQPADGDDNELDGFDEIFLPSDVGPWDGREGVVTNAIVDDELQPRIAALREAGAFVFAVFDSCHSGTMLRAVAADETDRRLDPALLGIPDEAIAAAEDASIRTRGGASAEESILDMETARGGVADSEIGGYVAFYAAQTTETTPELRLPAGDPNRQTYGLFSYTIAEVLASNPGITYRQAAQQILSDYVADNRNNPTPLFESDGESLDAVLLSGTPAEELRQWPVSEDRDTWRIPAGQLHQLNQGAVLAIMPNATAGVDVAPLGFAEVTSAQVVHSLITPIAYNDTPVLEAIPEGAFVRLVDAHFSVSLAVALPERPETIAPDEASAWAELDRLIDLGLDQVSVAWVPPSESADMRLHIDNGRLWLLPPSGELTSDSTYLTLPEPDNAIAIAEFGEDLADNLRKVARVNALFALANQLSATGIGRELTVALSVQRRDGTVETFGLGDFPRMTDGDIIMFEVTNSSSQVVDLTALFIDSQFGIEPWFPYQGESNRMNPGESLTSSLEVNASTVGVERFLFIAAGVQPGATRADFSFLAQSGMTTRALGTSGLSGATIADVLADAGVDMATTRGGGRPAMSLATVSSFSWTVAPLE